MSRFTPVVSARHPPPRERWIIPDHGSHHPSVGGQVKKIRSLHVTALASFIFPGCGFRGEAMLKKRNAAGGRGCGRVGRGQCRIGRGCQAADLNSQLTCDFGFAAIAVAGARLGP